MSAVQIGNAGEHYVMACLLARGHHAGIADRGNPHFDIILRTPSGASRSVRIKTTRGTSLQWTAKDTWNPLPGFNKEHPDLNDLTVLVAVRRRNAWHQDGGIRNPHGAPGRRYQRVPHHYHQHRHKDGSERVQSTQRVFRLDGKRKPDDIAYGFRTDWAEFRDAWHLIDGETSPLEHPAAQLADSSAEDLISQDGTYELCCPTVRLAAADVLAAVRIAVWARGSTSIGLSAERKLIRHIRLVSAEPQLNH